MKISRRGAAAVIVAVSLIGLATAANAAYAGSTGDSKVGSAADNPPPVGVNPRGSVTHQWAPDLNLSAEDQVKQAMAEGGLTEAQARDLIAMTPK